MARRLPLLLLAASLGVAGCVNPFFPEVTGSRGASEPPPEPTTASKALELFVWCWENKNIDRYEELFTEDYRFAFAEADSVGDAYQDRAANRDEDLLYTRHLFQGGGSEPPARRIILRFDPELQELPDSRPGKTYPWHKEIRTSVDLTIETSSATHRVMGSARFFLVSGDSAVIPQELKDRGFGPDPNRWYIERWEDETDTGAGAFTLVPAAAPLRVGDAMVPRRAPSSASLGAVTWGWVKHLYSR